MTRLIPLTAVLLSLLTPRLLANQTEAFQLCPHIADAGRRLACYDSFAGQAADASAFSLRTVSFTAADAPAERQAIPALEAAENNALLHFARLSADDPNFFGVSSSAGGKNSGVETHLEFDISIKYPFGEDLLGKANDRFGEGVPDRFFFIYNGSYDFQALTGAGIYDSSPVISKTQNPGFAFEWDGADRRSRWRLGGFHHSNGQTLNDPYDPDNPNNLTEQDLKDLARRDANLAEFNTVRTNWGEAPALEKVSRSSWYLQARYQRMSNPEGRVDSNWYQYQFEIRPRYLKMDDEIFWSPIPEEQPNLQEFDGIRFVGEKMIPFTDAFSALVRMELQTGLWHPGENIGGEISLGVRWGSLLVNGYYYNGFAKDIATYHKRTKHIGIGLELR